MAWVNVGVRVGFVWWGRALISSVRSVFMSPFLRKVKTASGAMAVQIVEKKHGQRRILGHLGSAHAQAGLSALMQVGREKLAANQPALDFDEERPVGRPRTAAPTNDYREQLAAASFEHVWNQPGRDVSLLLYDVTTLYFEARKEDGLRKAEFSKEPRELVKFSV